MTIIHIKKKHVVLASFSFFGYESECVTLLICNMSVDP